MDLLITPATDDAVALTARFIIDKISHTPDAVLGLATGRTMQPLYAQLVAHYNAGAVDFSSVRTFNLDEYIGVPADNENSYRYYMNTHLFSKININPAHTYLPNGMARDPADESAAYEAHIRAAGGIDLQLLGLGSNGHIGFNEPLSSFRSRTRETILAEATITQNGALFKNGDTMPTRVLTMGIGTIMEAKKIVMLVTGKSKAAILAQMLEGPLTAMVPASILHFHPDVVVVCDEDAATELDVDIRAQRRRAWEREARWAPYR